MQRGCPDLLANLWGSSSRIQGEQGCDAPMKAVWTSQTVALGNGSSASLILNAIQPATMQAEEAAVYFKVLLCVT